MYNCLQCDEDSSACHHNSYATLGFLFYVVRKFVDSRFFQEGYSELAEKQLVLGELRVGHSQGNYLVTLTTRGRLLVLANIPKVLRELDKSIAEWQWDPNAIEKAERVASVELMNTYVTLAELPQFLTSDSTFIRDMAEKRFQELTAEVTHV